MNESKFGVRKWLWLVLIGVIVIGAAYVGWNRYGGNGTTETATTSPTPTKSLALSPSAGTSSSPALGKTSTPSDDQTSTPSTTSTPAVETKTYEGSVPFDNTTNLSCNITVSFKYPSDFSVARGGGTPTVGGANYISIYKDATSQGGNSILINAGSADINHDYSPVSCATPAYANLNDYASRNNISNFNSVTLNGLSAIQYTVSGKKQTAIQNSDKNVAIIELLGTTSASSDAYNIIINSLSFK